MVSFFIRFLFCITSILLYLTITICLQNDHTYQQYSYEDRDQYDTQEPRHMSHSDTKNGYGSNGEITTEHLLRYWGSPLDQSVDPMLFLPKEMNIYPDAKQQMSSDSRSDVRSVSSISELNQNNGLFLASSYERKDVNQLRSYILNSGSYSRWLQTISDTEILRFLRARKGDVDAAWVMLWDHSIWRQCSMGSETLTSLDDQIFEASSLNDELYWAGQAYDGNPVLFFRSGLHQSGADALFYTR